MIALQSIVARNVDPLESAVVSITMVQAGTTDNVIPQTARLDAERARARSDVREMLRRRIQEM